MIKIGDECFVSTLPRHIFPVDIALGIQEIKKGNNITIKEDELETQGIIVGLGSLDKEEENELHTDIKNRCSNANFQKFKEMPITKEQDNDLQNGKIILLDQTSSRSNCELLVHVFFMNKCFRNVNSISVCSHNKQQFDKLLEMAKS